MTSTLTHKGSTNAWRKIRARILRRDNNVCQYCGAYADTVDHIKPRSHGGSDDPSNLVACCRRCQGPVDRSATLTPRHTLAVRGPVFKNGRSLDMPLSRIHTHKNGSEPAGSGSEPDPVITRDYTRRR